ESGATAGPGSLGRRPCPSSVEPSAKLAPAQNALPWAASTMARILTSSSKLSNASAISLIKGISKKLCGGRRISTRAMCPLFSTPMSLMMCVSLSGCGAALCLLQGALEDQRVCYADPIALAVHDDGIEIDLSDVVRVIGCEL